MPVSPPPHIVIRGARTNNLKDISLRIPHNQLVVVTGVSGSGKSSLVFELIAKEGQRRYFETLPSFARQFLGKLNRPDVDEIEGLSPVIAIGQQRAGGHARSTVGTISDLYDLLRLLYARAGKSPRQLDLSRALFSFNSPIGKCQQCNGIGKEEKIDLRKLVSASEKTIREGALAPTLPNGYIMYSQVTIDVLNQVCEAEGFNVDIPWNELTDAQRLVVLHGSDKIKVPFGKHSLESRLKWTGIKAKPREEGHYKGLIPIMSDILRRDRNANILKYVHAVTCNSCGGTRLNADARSVQVHGKAIDELGGFELHELKQWVDAHTWSAVATEIIHKLTAQVDLLQDLGLGHLTLDRPTQTLRASELQRIRVANQLLVPLSNVLYVFDEPSIGLHAAENQRLIHHLKQLVRKGNTVIVVEHDLDTIRSADHIIDIGPGAGGQGGEVLFNGSYKEFFRGTSRSISGKKDLSEVSPTFRALNYSPKDRVLQLSPKPQATKLRLLGCFERNLKHIDVSFLLGGLNVVSGRSGAGKSSLVIGTLLKAIRQQLGIEDDGPVNVERTENLDKINKLIFIDHSPIGKTPRSNPATYLGISDHLRDLFARLPEAKARGYTKSRFSFNNKGGRCETCQGAGKTQIGMHFLGNVDLICGTCNGDRFNTETLKIKYENHSIAQVYQFSIDEAVNFFEEEPKVLSGLKILQEIGLGYLTLGQSSTTLSGGEAQRIKIANQLQKKDTGDTLYIIIEPSIGLHPGDVDTLLQLFDRIKQQGNTIVCIEQGGSLIARSDWHLELGPESGSAGGTIHYEGVPKVTSTFVKTPLETPAPSAPQQQYIELRGVTTHGLKNIDVSIPKNQLTVVTGLSGSGKSTLVYDTLFAESNARFTESLSTYNRSFLQQNSEAELTSFSGLGPSVGINRRVRNPSRRSTVGTLSGVYDSFRLLYSRIAQQEGLPFTAQHFSFNHHQGACPACEGLGIQRRCDPGKVIFRHNRPLFDGALSTNKALGYYTDANGQFVATLKEVARQKHWNLEQPWLSLDPHVQKEILFGTGDQMYDVTWAYTTKARTGTQELSVPWMGFCTYINQEYLRKLHNKNIKVLEELLNDVECTVCDGSRLKAQLLETTFMGLSIHELSMLPVGACLKLLSHPKEKQNEVVQAISKVVLPSVTTALQSLSDLGLEYVSLERSVSTLSGGERQRVTLAGQLSAHLFGVTYVLDEPTIGLDATQIEVLAKALKQLVKKGNTVVVVEHDPSLIQQADYLIEMGPGAGSQGGEVIYQGTIEGLQDAPETVTFKLLNRSETLSKSRNQKGLLFGLKGAVANNLKSIDVDFYAGQLTAITGVSGSGKSSLIKEVLFRSWQQGRPVQCKAVHGMDQFAQVLLIDQSPLRQSRLTTTASYMGILDSLRSAFAKTQNARDAGLKRADFSYQSKKGRCSVCAGYGKLKTSMDFMSDLWLSCDACRGLRYNDEVLACLFNGRSIGEVLQMTVSEAAVFFKAEKLEHKLRHLERVGVGHLRLGQAANTLSGGEAQRLKLAKHTFEKCEGSTLFLIDEPSTGLHHFDLLPLIDLFESLVAGSDTILFIEHNQTLIEVAEQVIRLGPGSGAAGGEVV